MTTPLVIVGKNRDRLGNPAPICAPFYSKGNTWRGEHELKMAGWYWTCGKTLHGPYMLKRDCYLAMRHEG